jgi:hypothetical protein
MVWSLDVAPRRDATSCAAHVPRLCRARLGFRAVRQLRAAPSPGVAHTEATLGVRTATWSLRVRRRPRPPIPAGPSPALLRSHAPVEVWDIAPASAAAGVQGGRRAHIWGGSLPKEERTAPQRLPERQQRVSPEPTATKHRCGSSHDHQPLGQLLVRRQPSIEPLPRRSRTHDGHRRLPPERRSPAVPPHKFRCSLAPR